jgi:hypothetical protein
MAKNSDGPRSHNPWAIVCFAAAVIVVTHHGGNMSPKTRIIQDSSARQQSPLATQDIHAIFAPGGLLAQTLHDYEARPGQQQLSESIMDASEDEEHLATEAATGIEKSLGYLAPLTASDTQAIVSTETKILQNQLRD